MKSLCSFLVLLSLAEFLLLSELTAAQDIQHGDVGSFDMSFSVLESYTRYADIESQCSSYLSSASELSRDGSRDSRLRNALSFNHGDWKQNKGGSPLFLYDDNEMPKNSSVLASPLKLVDFNVRYVNPVQNWKNAVSLIGLCKIGIYKNSRLGYITEVRPGLSAVSIRFEGVYVESKENGERLLCMLGNTKMPSKDNSTHSADFTGPNCCNHRPLVNTIPDDKILLVIRYPRSFSLTRRVIWGEMTSLQNSGSSSYFDKIYMSSQLAFHPYSDVDFEFSPERQESITCNSDLYEKDSVDNNLVSFDAAEFCRNFRSLYRFDVAPQWKSKGGYMNQSNFGPFRFGEEMNVDELNYHNVKLIMQNLNCLPVTTQVNNNVAKVYAVFRVVPYPWDNDIGTVRTGPSSMTLSAEGTWNSQSGMLCMIGCLGSIDDLKGCNSQVSLFFPRLLSITERSICVGSISSFNNENGSYLPLTFSVQLSPYLGKIDYKFYSSSYLTYNYSKIELASEYRERIKPDYLSTMIKKALLRYPAPGNQKDSFEIMAVLQQSSRRYPELGNGKEIKNPASLCNLFDTLKISTFGVASSNQESKIRVELHVLSLGPLFGCNADSDDGNQAPFTNHQLINVSLNLKLSEKTGTSKLIEMSNLFLEGVYDPLVGDMYLIGCRKVITESPDLERGLDCLIEVKIEYSSFTLWCLRNPIATITVKSKRDTNDPLFFAPVRILNLEFNYQNKNRDRIFRKLFEAFLKISLALMIVVAIFRQLDYTENNQDAISYISLVMLATQILGYSLPVISGVDSLSKLKEYPPYGQGPIYIPYYGLYFRVLDYIGKVILLASLLLTSRLFQKVLASRNRHLRKLPSRLIKHVPSDKKVLLITLALHNLGFFISLAIQSMLVQPRTEKYTAEHFYGAEGTQVLPDWLFRLDEYVSIIQDFFLLPQVLGNFLWHINVRPLSKAYYIGITLLRILQQHFYNIREPALRSHYPTSEIDNIDGNAFSKFANIASVFVMLSLAAIVHFQQHYQKHQKIGHQLK